MQHLDTILREVREEIIYAQSKFSPFNSAHEGYAILLEELDELWVAVCRKNDPADAARNEAIIHEAIQVAAMAIRLVLDMPGYTK